MYVKNWLCVKLLYLNASGGSSPEISPRTRLKREEDVDFTVTSLGCFLDLLLEKVSITVSTQGDQYGCGKFFVKFAFF